MPHYCRICDCYKSNESFSGKGHRTHVCKKCQQLPKAQRQAIEQREEITKFLYQGNISTKNMVRLRELMRSPDAEIVALANVVLDIALIKPHIRRRISYLLKHAPLLLEQMIKLGLLDLDHPDHEWLFEQPVWYDLREEVQSGELNEIDGSESDEPAHDALDWHEPELPELQEELDPIDQL